LIKTLKIITAIEKLYQKVLLARFFGTIRENQAAPIRRLSQNNRELPIGQRCIFHENCTLSKAINSKSGSLIFVGSGKKSSIWLQDVLEGRDRHHAAPTFMPDGLYLAKIDYDKKWQLPQQSGDSLF